MYHVISNKLCDHVPCFHRNPLPSQDCTKALSMIKDRGDKKSLKSMKKKQISMLTKFSDAIRGNLTPIQRAKIVALVTIEVHARDVIDKLIKSNCNDVMGFEWLMQLRFYWEKVNITSY